MRKSLLVLLVVSLTAAAFAAGSATKPPICDRACWGAASATCSTNVTSLNRAIVHHTANTNDFSISTYDQGKARVRATQNYHKVTLGWCDIGYHFLVDKLNYAYEGRVRSMTQLVRGAHDGINTNSFGFCLLGWFDSGYNGTPPSAMRHRLYDVVAWRIPDPFTGYGSSSYGSYSTVGYIDGHSRVSSKTCPGTLMYQYIGTSYSSGEMRNEVNARIVGTPQVSITRDNDTTNFTASSNWYAATNAQNYGTNFRWRSTEAIGDAATWTLGTITYPGNYNVAAWWVEGTNRSASAPYVIQRGDTTTTTVNVNQKVNGGKWNAIGTMYFWQGTNRNIKLSCWTTTGFVVVADAVRIRNY